MNRSPPGGSVPLDYVPYAPRDRPVTVTDGVWTVEGPVVPFAVGPMTVPCPTRATVLADPAGGLWLHSPVRFDGPLHERVSALGPIRGIIAPNRFHCAHVGAWARALPDAAILVAPGAEGRIDGRVRDRACSSATHLHLDGWLRTIVVDGGSWTELVCFHEASRTLVFTDLWQNFELDRVRGRSARLLLRASGAGRGPVLSRELRVLAALAGARGQVRDALARIARLPAARVLIAHGRQPDPAALRRILSSY